MINLASPAKINLFLRVLRRRSDGYHELASLFQTVDLCDRLQMSLSDEDELYCTMPTLPVDRNNLVRKAVDLFRQKSGLRFGLKAILEKRIPIQAGLGGGSSNAATTLWGVNRLLGSPIPMTDLMEWAGELGSDVPFFLSSGTAYCTGRGEIVRDLPPLKNRNVWIVKPEEGLSTPSVFNRLEVSSLPNIDPEQCLNTFFTNSPHYFNDLEGSAIDLIPALSKLKNRLMTSGFDHCFLTGTGTSFVCIGVPTEPASLQGSPLFCKQASFINRSLQNWYLNES